MPDGWVNFNFQNIRIWDILDVLIVVYLIYLVYKLLRGSAALNIFIGVVFVLVIWWIVGKLEMSLLSRLLGQFVSIGVITLIIIFQPEVRRFLLLLGNTTQQGQSRFFRRFINNTITSSEEEKEANILEIKKAIIRMSKSKTGALIILTDLISMENYASSGVEVNGQINQLLIESIFNKEGPLHDGAMVISEGLIKRVSCVLPLFSGAVLPRNAGLRHRAALGASEQLNTAAIIVSEENGNISLAVNKKLSEPLNEVTLHEKLIEHYR